MGEQSGPTRRLVLAGLGGIGTAGAIGGAATLAALSDEEEVAGQIRAGTVDLQIDCDGTNCTATEDGLELGLPPLDPGTAGHTQVRLQVAGDSNPVSLWLRTDCPRSVDPLGDALEVRLTVDRNCDDTDGDRVLSDWQSLTALQRSLSDGVELAGQSTDCLDSGQTLCLGLDYRLPADATWASDSTSTLSVELRALQCRNTTSSPFEPVECPDYDCTHCIELGKIEVDGDRLEAGSTQAFDELFAPFDDDGHDYELAVPTVTDKIDDGERETVCASFRLLRNGSETAAPPLCRVLVVGGQPDNPGGDKPGPPSRGVEYDITPPLTRTRGEVCAARDTDNPETEPDGRRPAISNVTVSVCRGAGSDGGANR